MSSLKKVLTRITAVFAASALGVIGAGAIAGVELWKAMLMAGIGGIATVIEGLSRSYIYDGELSKKDIDDVFRKAHEKIPE